MKKAHKICIAATLIILTNLVLIPHAHAYNPIVGGLLGASYPGGMYNGGALHYGGFNGNPRSGFHGFGTAGGPYPKPYPLISIPIDQPAPYNFARNMKYYYHADRGYGGGHPRYNSRPYSGATYVHSNQTYHSGSTKIRTNW